MMLFAIAVLYGVLASLVFRAFVKPAELRNTANHMVARIMEFALFVDEPGAVFRAQIALLRENFRLLKQIALPCLIMATAFALVYPTMKMHFDNPSPDVLTLPGGSEMPARAITGAPPVHIFRTNEVSWRIRPVPTQPHWLLWFVSISTLSALIVEWGRRSYFARGSQLLALSAN